MRKKNIKEQQQHTHEDCNCEHHQHANGVLRPVGCPTDSWVDNLLENLKKEFDDEKKTK